MKTIIYFHGFASSGATGTATNMRNALYDKDVRVLSPDIPIMPNDALPFLRSYVEQNNPDLIIGTSMGAMYAELMKGYKRILVNPAFGMARLLTFKIKGRQQFLNKREDGAKEFRVDKEMVTQFKDLEKQSFAEITDEEKKNVYGLFGNKDTLANFQAEFIKHYGKEHFTIFEGEHHLNDNVVKKVVYPLITEVLGI